MALSDLGFGHVRDYHDSKLVSILNVVILVPSTIALPATTLDRRLSDGQPAPNGPGGEVTLNFRVRTSLDLIAAQRGFRRVPKRQENRPIGMPARLVARAP